MHHDPRLWGSTAPRGATNPHSLGSSALKGGLLSLAGLVALGLTRVVHGLIVSRATDNDTYATVGTLIGVAMAAGLFLPGGLASAASRFIPHQLGRGDLARARAVYRLLTAVGIVTAIAGGVAVGLGAAALSRVDIPDAVAVGVLTAVYAAYSVAKGALYGFDRLRAYTWLELAGSVTALVATLMVVTLMVATTAAEALAGGAHTYLWPLTAGYAVLAVGALPVLRATQRSGRGGRALRATQQSGRRGGSVSRATQQSGRRGGSQGHPTKPAVRLHFLPDDHGAGREIAEYTALAALGGGASAGLLQALPLLAGWFTTPQEVSYFVAAVTLVTPLLFLPRALGLALFPALSRAQGAGNRDAITTATDRSTRVLLATAPLFAAGILLARDALVIFGGERYAGGDAVLRVLLLATYVASVPVAAVNALASGRRFRVPVWAAVAGAVLGLVLLVPAGRWFGSAGIGTAYLVAVVITTALPLVAAGRGLAWRAPAARAFAVVLIALGLGQVIDVFWPYGLIRVILDTASAISVAGIGMLVLRRDITRALRAG